MLLLLLLLVVMVMLDAAAVMIFLVASQRSRVAVALAASVDLASERFCTSVGQQVSVQVVLTFKCFAANVAVVPPLLAVSQAMLGEGRGVGEDLAADCARLRGGLCGQAGA